jgi:hypothetical protein
MKIVEWNDDTIPEDVDPISDDYLKVVDCRWWFDLEVGDQIQYTSELGTECYFVVDRQPTTTDGNLGEGVYNVIIKAAW